MSYYVELIFGEDVSRVYDEYEDPLHEDVKVHIRKYKFDSMESKEGFLKGVEEAVGWLDYRVIEHE